MERVRFDGVDLTSLFTVTGIVRPMPVLKPVLENVSGSDDISFFGSTIEPPELQFTMILNSGDAVSRRQDVRQIAPLLLKREPVKVEFESDNGLYYMAIIQDSIDLNEFVNSGSVLVKMKSMSAAMYGDEKQVTVTTGGSLNITVGGTYATKPRIAGTVTRNLASGVWGLRLDDKDFVHIDTGANAARQVVIDCENRTATVSSAAAQITLDSDWLILEPGTHKLTNDQGSGTVQITYTERWL